MYLSEERCVHRFSIQLNIFISSYNITYLYVEQRWKSKRKNLKSAQVSRCEYYHIWNVDEHQSNGRIKRLVLGLGDFLMFSFMLLLVLNPLLSLRTNIWIFLGHIIAVHVGHEGKRQLGIICRQAIQPALLDIRSFLLFLFAILNLEKKLDKIVQDY